MIITDRPVLLDVGITPANTKFVNDGPSTVYYKTDAAVSAGLNDGSLTVGSSLTVTGPRWLVTDTAMRSTVSVFQLAPNGTSTSTTAAAGSGNKVYVIGDSITANGLTAGGGYEPRAWYVLASMLSDARFHITGVGGTGGFTIAQVQATHLPGALASDAQFVLVQAGRNDVLAPTAIATVIATFKAVFASIVNAGKTPILTTQLAQGTSGTPNSTAQKLLKDQIDTFLRLYARSNRWPLIDFAAVTTDPTGGYWLSSLSADVSHPNAAGAKVMAAAMNTALTPYLPPGQPYRPLDSSTALSGVNLVTNGLMLTDAGADGIPDSATGQWTVPGSWTGTGTFSLVAASSGDTLGQWFKISRTGGAGNKGSQVPPSGQSVTTSTAGNKMAFTFKAKTASVETGSATFHARAFSGATIYAGLNGYTADLPSVGRYYSEFTVQSGLEAIGVHFVITAGTGDLLVSEVALVDLTAQGLA